MIEETLLEAEEKMEKAVGVAKDDFNGIRTGRAHPLCRPRRPATPPAAVIVRYSASW